MKVLTPEHEAALDSAKAKVEQWEREGWIEIAYLLGEGWCGTAPMKVLPKERDRVKPMKQSLA